MKRLIIVSIIFLSAGCGDLPCMKSYKLHLKANLSKTQAEREYYEKQAQIFDAQCAEYNEQEYVKRQQEELHKHKPWPF